MRVFGRSFESKKVYGRVGEMVVRGYTVLRDGNRTGFGLDTNVEAGHAFNVEWSGLGDPVVGCAGEVGPEIGDDVSAGGGADQWSGLPGARDELKSRESRNFDCRSRGG
jgi:hypothetical protein